MRPLLVRLLLLAVFFNAAIGVPMHAAEHLHESPMQAAHAGSVDGAARDEGAMEKADNDAESAPAAHAACAWCSALGHAAWLGAPQHAVRVPFAEAALPVAPPLAAAPAPLHRPFAARDPPRA